MTTPRYDYSIKRKIKSWAQGTSEAQKQAGLVSRARKGHVAASVAKLVKKAASISELLTEDDQEENVRVIREAKQATHRIYDQEQKKLVEVPDHKSRLAAVVLDLAYREGRPVERQIQIAAKADDLGSVLAKLHQSPEAVRMMQKLGADLPAIDVESDVADSREQHPGSSAT